jgi:hypothetical protein
MEFKDLLCSKNGDFGGHWFLGTIDEAFFLDLAGIVWLFWISDVCT